MSDKSWEPGMYECFDVLNNFCFHVYAQNLLSHFLTLTLSISHSITLDMLNNFCFHVYAQNSLFIAENFNDFFWDIITLSSDFRVHRAGSQLKINFRRNMLKTIWITTQII